MRTSILAGFLIASISFCGCSSNPAAPSNAPVVPQASGEFTGPVTDSALGKGTADLTLTQTASSLGGAMSETFGGTTLSGSAAITIDINGNVIPVIGMIPIVIPMFTNT